ncbi:MAG: asparaginase domain-containing protein, partial [Candidatus Micrarchaeota archaeon]
MYSQEISQMLSSLSISLGDEISYSKGGLELKGIVMPNSNAGDPNCLKLKLPSGYNLGLEARGATISKGRAMEKKEGKEKAHLPPSTPKKVHAHQFAPAQRAPERGAKKIALITTGGTIAAKVDYKTGAVSAKISPQDFLEMYPGISSLAQIEIYPVLNALSENMVPGDWAKIAEVAAHAIDGGASGVVITHGTDVMGYTAAALSYALSNLGVPVILTGSQRSPDRPSSDAYQNIVCSIHAAL